MYLFKILFEFIQLPSTKEENDFRYQVLKNLLPILIAVFLVVAYIIFPIRFGFDSNFFNVPNVRSVHGVLFTLALAMYFVRKTRSEGIFFLLPTILVLVTIQSFMNNELMSKTPFIPFYATIMSIVFGMTFLKLKHHLIYLLTFLPIFFLFGLRIEMPYSEFLHRATIVIVVASFSIALSFARKKIFNDLKEKTDELLAMSNIQILAELSGGIAHEINNPLQIIGGTASSIKTNISKDNFEKEKIIEKTETIKETVSRISSITESLLVLAQKDAEDKTRKKVNLKETILESISPFKEKLKQSKIDLQMDNCNENLMIECVPVQLMQVFVNLFSNSIHAVSSLDEKWIRIECNDHNDLVCIRFIDSGKGIPKEVRQSVHKPFFTTKEKGVGTGLGLSISTRIINSEGGRLTLLEDEPHTTFENHLPLS